jgi:TonB family protein
MTPTKKLPWRNVFAKGSAILFCFLLFILADYEPSRAGSFSRLMVMDTVPQAEIFNLKRADVYVVITEPDTARILLKTGDSIMMNRANFDALPEQVKKEISANGDGVFKSEQIEVTYPGGPSGWMSYLNRTFKYPLDAQQHQIQGTVVVQFIVDETGKVSDIEAVSGPRSGGLREETIRLIKKSGNWTPAIWNGYRVKSYKRQPITFKLGTP